MIKRYGFKNDFNYFRIFDLFGMNYRKNTFSFLKHEYDIDYFNRHSNFILIIFDFNWNNFNNNIICDICFKDCISSDKGYSCRDCDLDICEECVIKINKTK